jgi:hypothetical protein
VKRYYEYLRNSDSRLIDFYHSNAVVIRGEKNQQQKFIANGTKEIPQLLRQYPLPSDITVKLLNIDCQNIPILLPPLNTTIFLTVLGSFSNPKKERFFFQSFLLSSLMPNPAAGGEHQKISPYVILNDIFRYCTDGTVQPGNPIALLGPTINPQLLPSAAAAANHNNNNSGVAAGINSAKRIDNRGAQYGSEERPFLKVTFYPPNLQPIGIITQKLTNHIKSITSANFNIHLKQEGFGWINFKTTQDGEQAIPNILSRGQKKLMIGIEGISFEIYQQQPKRQI